MLMGGIQEKLWPTHGSLWLPSANTNALGPGGVGGGVRVVSMIADKAMCVLCQEFEKQVTKEMQQVTEYFGEGYDATDPAKVLRVIRDFMMLFDKSIFEIKVCMRSHNCQCLSPIPGNSAC